MSKAEMLATLPVRGSALADLGLPLPRADESVHRTRPRDMPLFWNRRPLKRWRYVGAYGPDVAICVGDAHIGPIPQRWWAIATPQGIVAERTTIGSGGLSMDGSRVLLDRPDARIELMLDEGPASEPSESVNRHGEHGFIWTRKRAGIPARGSIRAGETEHLFDGHAVVDETAGYHARETEWMWSAGVGRSVGGAVVAWNLVVGVNDGPTGSERAVWVDGRRHEIGPVEFSEDLTAVRFAEGGELRCTIWGAREHKANLLLIRSAYRQPFGTFSGELPGAGALAEGYGVTEWHSVHW